MDITRRASLIAVYGIRPTRRGPAIERQERGELALGVARADMADRDRGELCDLPSGAWISAA